MKRILIGLLLACTMIILFLPVSVLAEESPPPSGAVSPSPDAVISPASDATPELPLSPAPQKATDAATPSAGPSTSPTQEPTQEPQGAGAVLSIDNNSTYDGMDKPYKSGYMPSATGGVAKIVLPLESALELKDNRISVSFDLGDPTASPFQFGNYDQTIKLAKHKTSGGEKEAYLIHVDFPLAVNRSMGRYPVVVHTSGNLADGTPFAQDFTVFVTITDGIDPNATPTPSTEPTPEPEKEEVPVPQPKIMLNSYTVNPSPVVAGEQFHLSASLLNTNENQSINNVSISIVNETATLLPSGADTGNFYFEKISKGESVTLEMDMVTSPNVKPEPQKLTINIEYEGNKATAYTASEEIVIPVTQPIRLEYDEPQIPKDVNAGDTISVSMNVMNMGIGAVHNVRFSMEAPGLIPDKTAFMGNIESGAAKKGDMYVFVGTKDMTGSADEAEKYGATSGVISLVYEDEYGKEYTEEFEVATNINPPVIMAQEEPETEEEPKNQSQWWVSIIIAGAIIAAIFGIRFYIKKKRERQNDEDK